MSSTETTLFTKIINGQIPGRFVWADDLCVAFATIEPHTDGHVLVVPRQEVDSYVDAPDELLAHLAVVAKRIGATQTRVFNAPKAAVLVVGMLVNHLHIHVFPITSELDVNTSVAHAAGGEELDAAMEALRAGLRADGWAAHVPVDIGAPTLP